MPRRTTSKTSDTNGTIAITNALVDDAGDQRSKAFRRPSTARAATYSAALPSTPV